MGIKILVDSRLSDDPPTSPSLLLGTSSPPRILHAIPELPPPPRAPSIPWAVEHVRMLRSTLPGGIDVVGMYVKTSSQSSSATVFNSDAVDSAVYTARRIIPENVRVISILTNSARGRLTAKTIERESDADGNSIDGDLRPAEVRLVPRLTDTLVEMRGYIRLSGVTPLGYCSTDDKSSRESRWVNALHRLASRAVVMALPLPLPSSGKTTKRKDLPCFLADVNDTRPLKDVLHLPAASAASSKKKKNAGNSLTPRPVVTVHIHLPLAADASPCEARAKDGGGDGDGDGESTQMNGSDLLLSRVEAADCVEMNGTMFVHALLPVDSSVGEALRAIRSDIYGSALGRAHAVADIETDAGEEEGNDVSSRNEAIKSRHENASGMALPARVVSDSVPGDAVRRLPFSDYMVEEEVMDDVIARLCEVLSWSKEDVDRAGIHAVETVGVIADVLSSKRGLSESLNTNDKTDGVEVASRDVPIGQRGADEERDNEEVELDEKELPPILVNGLIMMIAMAILAIIIREFF